MDMKGHAEILSVFQREYCDRSEIPLEELIKYLQIPPMNTVVRADRISCERQEGTIRNGLFEENRDRIILPDCLSLARIPELENVWIIRNICCTPDISCNDSMSQCATDHRHTGGEMLPEVVVDCAAGESCLRGAHIYAQGIMGCPSNVKKGDRVRIVSDVDGTCLKGRTCKFDGTRRYVGQGVLQYSRCDLFGANSFPSGIGIHVDHPCYPLLSLNEFLRINKHFFAQNLPSCVAVQVLNPQPEEVILDCCAAPGGKTMHIASLMRYRGRLVATDKSQQRVEELRKLCCDLDGFLEVYPADATNMLADAHCQNTRKIGPPPFMPEMFDRILVDAPCSGSGLRPRLSLKSLHLKQICSCPRNQQAILKGVVPLLKCGGTLVYSTCSILQIENEDVVAWILKEFPNLHLASQTPQLGKYGFLVDGLSVEQSRLLQRFSVIPETDGLDTIGFFIAKFVKSC